MVKTPAMTVIEAILTSGLIAWGIASLCYAFRVKWVHGLLARTNHFTAYVHWAMFNASADGEPGPESTLEIEYEDRDAGGGALGRGVISTAFSCGWRGFVWLPERRMATRLGEIMRSVRSAAGGGRLSERATMMHMELIRAYLSVERPLGAGARREIRVVERFVPAATGAATAGQPGEKTVILATIRHD